MEISKKELLHIADLASLNLKDEEVNKYLDNLKEILNYAEVVSKLPTEGLEETVSVNKLSNVLRKDEVKPFEDRDLLLENAPDKERDMFKIPKVIQ